MIHGCHADRPIHIVFCGGIARPQARWGAVTLALLFGLFNLIYGGWALTQGIELRRTQHTLDTAVREPHAA